MTQRAAPLRRAGVETAAGETDLADAALVTQAQRDPRAFGPLYDRYVEPVYRYCHRRLGSHEAAEEATSRVFTQALTALPRYRDQSFRGWLFTIAHNVIVDRFRAQPPEQPLEAALDIVDAAPTPEELAVSADVAARLTHVLGRLSPGQRDVVELRLSGLTGPEIARVLGRSHNAVKIAQFRAYARLRELLTAEEENR